MGIAITKHTVKKSNQVAVTQFNGIPLPLSPNSSVGSRGPGSELPWRMNPQLGKECHVHVQLFDNSGPPAVKTINAFYTDYVSVADIVDLLHVAPGSEGDASSTASALKWSVDATSFSSGKLVLKRGGDPDGQLVGDGAEGHSYDGGGNVQDTWEFAVT